MRKESRELGHVYPDLCLGGDVLVEPAVEEHVADGGAHGQEMETEEGDVVIAPEPEGQVQILSQVEEVERQPAYDEEADRDYQNVSSPHVPSLGLCSSAIM